MKRETMPQPFTLNLSTPDTPQQQSGRRWRKPVAALLVLLLAGGGWAWMHATAKPAVTADAAREKPKTPVYELAAGDVATVASSELSINLPLSGSLMPLTQATVKSKVSGVVLETTVQEGMTVTAGQVIARLDGGDQRARAAQQQATLDEASARLALAKKNNVNSEALLRQNYISRNAYDTTQNSVELAQASVAAARAQLDMARIALNDTTLKAPLSGVVSKRYVQAGEKLAPDMPVMAIVNLSQLTLEAQVPASEIPRIRVGQDVQFRVDGFDQRNFSGKVARINPTTEAGSRAMLVYISVNNADGALRGGMFAKGQITTAKSAVRPLLPLAALRRQGNQDVVYRIDNGSIKAEPVTLGMRNEDEALVEVLSGLAPGAIVLAAPLDGVKPGSKVKLLATPAAAVPTPTSASASVPAPAPAPASKG
ncbi:MAG: efflux RND transporter periplasmic adaptor subunit [Pseudomonadota bacterium]|nr:efflux RND transporter periplasmic adaptor subunit [Pseudomonadota bacterium]